MERQQRTMYCYPANIYLLNIDTKIIRGKVNEKLGGKYFREYVQMIKFQLMSVRNKIVEELAKFQLRGIM